MSSLNQLPYMYLPYLLHRFPSLILIKVSPDSVPILPPQLACCRMKHLQALDLPNQSCVETEDWKERHHAT